MSSPYIKPFRARSEEQNFGKSTHLSLSLANLEGNPAACITRLYCLIFGPANSSAPSSDEIESVLVY